MMANQDRPRVAEIVSSHVRNHQVLANQLTALIVEVHRALAGPERAPQLQEPPGPAAPIRRAAQ